MYAFLFHIIKKKLMYLKRNEYALYVISKKMYFEGIKLKNTSSGVYLSESRNHLYISGIIFGNNSPQPMVNCQVNIIAVTEMTNGLKPLPTRNCPPY